MFANPLDQRCCGSSIGLLHNTDSLLMLGVLTIIPLAARVPRSTSNRRHKSIRGMADTSRHHISVTPSYVAQKYDTTTRETQKRQAGVHRFHSPGAFRHFTYNATVSRPSHQIRAYEGREDTSNHPIAVYVVIRQPLFAPHNGLRLLMRRGKRTLAELRAVDCKAFCFLLNVVIILTLFILLLMIVYLVIR